MRTHSSLKSVVALLTAVSFAATPFVTWDWAVAWWAQLREAKLGVTDSLSIRSVPGRGTVVRVQLPNADGGNGAGA